MIENNGTKAQGSFNIRLLETVYEIKQKLTGHCRLYIELKNRNIFLWNNYNLCQEKEVCGVKKNTDQS